METKLKVRRCKYKGQ